MNARTLWIVRIFGILVFLLLAWLMLDLYSELQKLRN
jgi:hypothetical protein